MGILLLRNFWEIKMDNTDPSLAAHTYYPRKRTGQED